MGCDWMSEVMKVQLVNNCTDPRHIKCLRTFTVSYIRLVSRVHDSRALKTMNKGNRQNTIPPTPYGIETSLIRELHTKAGPLRATTKFGIASPDVQKSKTHARPTRPTMKVPVCDSGASCIDLTL
jgi:hypothetical protein